MADADFKYVTQSKKDIMKPTDYIEWDNLKYTL